MGSGKGILIVSDFRDTLINYKKREDKIDEDKLTEEMRRSVKKLVEDKGRNNAFLWTPDVLDQLGVTSPGGRMWGWMRQRFMYLQVRHNERVLIKGDSEKRREGNEKIGKKTLGV